MWLKIWSNGERLVTETNAVHILALLCLSSLTAPTRWAFLLSYKMRSFLGTLLGSWIIQNLINTRLCHTYLALVRDDAPQLSLSLFLLHILTEEGRVAFSWDGPLVLASKGNRADSAITMRMYFGKQTTKLYTHEFGSSTTLGGRLELNPLQVWINKEQPLLEAVDFHISLIYVHNLPLLLPDTYMSTSPPQHTWQDGGLFDLSPQSWRLWLAII